MTNFPPKTAKSTRRRFSLALLGVLAFIAAASIAVYAAVDTTSPPRFYISAGPASQTVAAGQTANYAIALDRQNHFIEPVTVSVLNLPADATANFHPGPIPGSSSGSTMTVTTSTTTPVGTRTLTIKGSGGGVTSQTTVQLQVLAATAKNFTLDPRPSARTITEDHSTSYSIGISRTSNFSGPVAFSASGLPTGAIGSFSPAIASGTGTSTALAITTNRSVKPGRYPVVITGVGTAGSTQLTRQTSVALIIEEKKPFRIEGDPPGDLAPGAEQPLDLALTNSNNFDIYVREVQVSLDPFGSSIGCDITTNFAVDQMPSSVYPLVLPRDSTRTLSQLGVAPANRPAAKMLNLPVDQAACKGAQFNFQYSGVATKA